MKDELSGKRIRCVKCQSVITVPVVDGREPQSNEDAAARKVQGVNPVTAAPVIRRARRISDSASAVQPQTRQDPVQKAVPSQAVPSQAVPSQAVPSQITPVQLAANQAGVASSAGLVRARVVAGPRDVQADAVRHTAATLSAPPEDFETIRRKVFAAFTQPSIAPVPVSGGYRFGIVLVSFFMIMLPLIYVALIGAVGWAVWYHAINHTGMIAAASGVGSGRNAGRAVVLAFLAYLAPIVAGAGLVLFMIKPLFSKPATDSGRRTLKPEDEPLLFEFVDWICKAVNSPRPRRIDIDCNINASASFRRGILSMAGNDLVLTLGMRSWRISLVVSIFELAGCCTSRDSGFG